MEASYELILSLIKKKHIAFFEERKTEKAHIRGVRDSIV